MPSLCLGQRDALSSRHGADPLALGVGKYGPSDLEDLLIAPGQLPIAHPADSRTGRFVDDLELPGALAFVAGLALGDALWTLGAAQVAHHLRVAEYLLKEGKVPPAPWLDANDAPVGPCPLAHGSKPMSGAANPRPSLDTFHRDEAWQRSRSSGL